MRCSISICGVVIALAMAAMPTLLPGQIEGNPALAPVPPGMAESPEMVLGQYLLRRWEVTRQRPVVRLCGPTAVAVMTSAFITHLTRREYRSVDSIEVIATCPPRDSTSPWTWSPAFLPDADLVMILQISTGPLSSVIDALVGLEPSGDRRQARSRRERFEWDHQQGVGGMYLRFTDFEPPLSTQYQFPPTPAGLAKPPQMVVQQFLLHRLEVTGQVPIFQFCGPNAVTLMTPEFSAHLTRGEQRLADSVVVAPTCPGPWPKSRRSGADADLVVVRSILFGNLTSLIEAVTIPRLHDAPPYPHGHSERFEWNHRRGERGMVLTFGAFEPPD